MNYMDAKEARAKAMPIREKKSSQAFNKLKSEIERSINYAIQSGKLEAKVIPHKFMSPYYELSKQVVNEVINHFTKLGYTIVLNFNTDDEFCLSPETFIKISW